MTYDGSSRAAGVQLYLDGKPLEVDVIRDGLTKDITYGGEPNLAIGYRFRDNGFKGGVVDEFRVYNRDADAARGGAASVGANRATIATLVRRISPAAIHEPSTARRPRNCARRGKAHTAFVNPIPEIMVMDEMPTPKPATSSSAGPTTRPASR